MIFSEKSKNTQQYEEQKSNVVKSQEEIKIKFQNNFATIFESHSTCQWICNQVPNTDSLLRAGIIQTQVKYDNTQKNHLHLDSCHFLNSFCTAV